MSTILMSLSLGAISMIVTFMSGMISGVVRVGTLALRSCFVFCLASAAAYFVLMLFEMYNERLQKEREKLEKEAAESEKEKEETAEEVEEDPDAMGEYPSA